MDVFSEMGITDYGILLSEKDSIVYRGALAPELRVLTDPGRVHRVPDYSGATKEEREQRIDDIISIAHRQWLQRHFRWLWLYGGRRADGGGHGRCGPQFYRALLSYGPSGGLEG